MRCSVDLITMIWETSWRWPERLLPLFLITVVAMGMAILLLAFSSHRGLSCFVAGHRFVAGAVVLIMWCAYACVLAMGVAWTMYIYTTHSGLTLAQRVRYSSQAAFTCVFLGVLATGAFVCITAFIVSTVCRKTDCSTLR